MGGIGLVNVEVGNDLGWKWKRVCLSGEIVNEELFIGGPKSISDGQFDSSISNNIWVLHFFYQILKFLNTQMLCCGLMKKEKWLA